MTATNHALTGTLLAAFLPLPLALPLAYVSHFVLDALPHYSIPGPERDNSRVFRSIVYSDVLICLLVAATTIITHKWAMLAGGFVAYSPDTVWLYYYFKNGRRMHFKPTNRLARFHKDIQRYERPWGIWIELAYFAVLFPIFLVQVSK